MILQAERELLVEYGKRMSREKLTAGTGGNPHSHVPQPGGAGVNGNYSVGNGLF